MNKSQFLKQLKNSWNNQPIVKLIKRPLNSKPKNICVHCKKRKVEVDGEKICFKCFIRLHREPIKQSRKSSGGLG